MRIGRAQAIIIEDNKILFGYGNIGGKLGHFFIGGGIEVGETACEAVLREVNEEINVKGKIIFEFRKEVSEKHSTFLIDIGRAQCTLGYDPEEVGLNKKWLTLQKLIWLPLRNKESFTSIDLAYFILLIEECSKRKFKPEWLMELKQLVGNKIYDKIMHSYQCLSNL